MPGAEAMVRASGASVRVSDLVKDYGAVRAVDHVSLEIRPSEFMALLGPSGSGKTTILMTIAGFERPTAGHIAIGDRGIDHIPPHRRGIGMVFQKYALFPHMTVAANLAFPLEMRGVPKGERQPLIDEALRLVRLEGYGGRQPNQLSGGQQQRVALARALVYRPPVLLMDEPLGALDRKLREELQLELRELQRTVGATAVYVTHDQGEALTMADRIAVIHEGTLRQVGTPTELYERPSSAFVASFIGETNLVDGTLVEAATVSTVRTHGDHLVRVLSHPGAPLREGQSVRVGVRPERVRLASASPSVAGSSGLTGTVSQVVYLGDAVRYQVAVPGGPTLQVKVPVADDAGHQVGDAVVASFQPPDGRLFVRTSSEA